MSNNSNKLYPPLIDRNLPPIIYQQDSAGSPIKYVFEIPFQYNSTVSQKSISGIQLKITGTASNTEKVNFFIEPERFQQNNIIKCTRTDIGKKLTPKQLYKIQIAFIDKEGTIGYYSTVGITKCLDKSDYWAHIQELYDEEGNFKEYLVTNQSSFTGQYWSQDPAEKAIKYRFLIVDSKGAAFADTNWLVHDNSTDQVEIKDSEPRLYSQDTFTLNKTFTLNETYSILYFVQTANDLVINSVPAQIMDTNMLAPQLNAMPICKSNFEQGYIEVSLAAMGDSLTATSGAFKLLRASEKDNYSWWVEVLDFQLENQIPNIGLWRDYLVEQGVKYRYAVQQYNSAGTRSSRLMSNVVTADFEDAFLYDGERQLNIRYNPKVSTFKATHLEQKTDTIGGQFPYISRNGNTNYKELNISGLISMLMDEQRTFRGGVPASENGRASTWSLELLEQMGTGARTALSSSNFRQERDFKLEVLDWLSNGKPKLFRSPGEGNYIVRLMNVSLSPNDTLGRMLHTFSCSAYEIAECTIDNLKEYGIFTPENIVLHDLVIESIKLKDCAEKGDITENTCTCSYEFKYPLQLLRLENIPAQVAVTLKTKTGDTKTFYVGKNHYLDFGDISAMEVTAVTVSNVPVLLSLDDIIIADVEDSAQIIAQYSVEARKEFEQIRSFSTTFVALEQHISEGGNYSYLLNQNVETPGSMVDNISARTLYINKLQLKKRPVQIIYTDGNGNYYQGYAGGELTGQFGTGDENTLWDPLMIYIVQTYQNGAVQQNKHFFYLTHDVNGENHIYENIYYDCYINEEHIYLDSNEYTVTDLDNVASIKMGNGLYANVCYPRVDIQYND